MFSRLRCPLVEHRVARSGAVLAVLLLAAPATAQNPDIIATFQGSSPKASFAFKWKDEKYTRNVGLLNWDIPLSEISTGGFDRNFRTYCAEALVGVVAGRTYRFQLQAPEVPVAYDLPDTKEGQEASIRRAKYVRELFGRFYPQALKEDDPDAAFAFQVALWEVIHEGDLPENPVAPFSLFSGNFQADYPNLAQSPAFVQRAEGYLQALTGDDNVFYLNPALAGLELVRLTGLAGFAGEAAGQSQFALRSTRGGGAAGAGAMAGGAPVGGAGFPVGFGGFPGGGGGVGGFPGGFGTGFPFLPIGGGGSPSTVVPNVPVNAPPSSTNTPGTNVPPVNQPSSSSSTSSSGGTTSSSTSSGGSSTTSTTGGVTTTSTSSSGGAVPAPPGVLLGVLLFGALAGRRVLAQLRQPRVPDHG